MRTRFAWLVLALAGSACASTCGDKVPAPEGRAEVTAKQGAALAAQPSAPARPSAPDIPALHAIDDKLEAIKERAAQGNVQVKQAVLRALPQLQRARAEARMAAERALAATEAERGSLQAAADQALQRADQALTEAMQKLETL
jgi:hypothetical protein